MSAALAFDAPKVWPANDNVVKYSGAGSRTVAMSYDTATNRLTGYTDSAGTNKTLGYDSRGNVTTLGNTAFVYDRADQPISVSGGGYEYDGNLKRVKSFVHGETIYNVYDAAGNLAHVYNQNTGEKADYLRAAGKTIARVHLGQCYHYLHGDHLGSASASTTNLGAVDWRESYTPFGETLHDPAANDNHTGFTGHIKDKATGLNYMQARYYDPVGGRFLSIDPVTFMDTGEPSFFNRYAYAFNDPTNLTDPTGMAPGDEFDTYDEAVDDFASYVQSDSAVDRSGDSINIDSTEYGSVVSQTENEGGGTSFSYNQPNKGDRNTVQFRATQSEAENSVGTVHNHNGDGGTVSASQADAIGTPSTNRVSGRRGLNSGNGTRSGVDDATVSNTFSRHSNVATKRTFRTDILGPRQRTKGGTTRVVRGFTFRGSKPKRVR